MRIIQVLFILISMCSCAPMFSDMQKASTLGKGGGEFELTFGYANMDTIDFFGVIGKDSDMDDNQEDIN